jgi:CBS domain-containing protein
MTDNPVCCLPNDFVSQAARVMRREHLGLIAVVSDDQTRQIIGVVTDWDLAIKVVAEGRDPNRTTVDDVMTHAIVVCRDDEDLSNAIAAMEEYQIHRIPVVDRSDRIVGIISQVDVSNRLEGWKIAETITHVARAA